MVMVARAPEPPGATKTVKAELVAGIERGGATLRLHSRCRCSSLSVAVRNHNFPGSIPTSTEGHAPRAGGVVGRKDIRACGTHAVR
jgi:hypothetical protein